MTCIKITESQNGQIYPEDTFSHGAAHIVIQVKLGQYHRIEISRFQFEVTHMLE